MPCPGRGAGNGNANNVLRSRPDNISAPTTRNVSPQITGRVASITAGTRDHVQMNGHGAPFDAVASVGESRN